MIRRVNIVDVVVRSSQLKDFHCFLVLLSQGLLPTKSNTATFVFAFVTVDKCPDSFEHAVVLLSCRLHSLDPVEDSIAPVRPLVGEENECGHSAFHFGDDEETIVDISEDLLGNWAVVSPV